MQEFLILMYHEVTNSCLLEKMSTKTQFSYVLDAKVFEKQVNYIKNNNYRTGSISDTLRKLRQEGFTGQSNTINNIVLSFDDGFIGNYENVFPVLLENDLSGNFFLIAGKIGERHMMSWDQIREMKKYGMHFGSHTVNHSLLGNLKPNEIFQELDTSKKIIEDQLGSRVEYITLPHGSYNKEYKPAAIKAGYLGGCTSDPGLNDRGTDPFYLKRMPVLRSGSLQYFYNICEKKKSLYNKLLLKRHLARTAKKMIGEARYLKMYNKFFGVDG